MPRTDLDNQSRYWLDPATPGLSLLRADFRTHEYPPHIHKALLVAVTEIGGSQIEAGAGPDEAHSAALLVVNPTEPHSSRMNRSRHWRYRSFYLEAAALEDVMHGLGIDDLPTFNRNIVYDRGLIDDFLRLHRALERPDDRLRQRELLVGSFGRLVRRHASTRQRVALAPRDLAVLRSLTDLMHDQYAEHLSLQELAEAAGMTQFQVIRLFHQGVGMTPHAYITQIRLDAARDHLKRGASIASAAAASGFYDQAALTRSFKRCFAITPLQFAQASRPLAGSL